MKLLSGLRFHDEAEIEGTAEPVDRDQRRRDQRLRIAMSGRWPEIPRDRLKFDRYHVTDTGTNELYTIVRGEVDAEHTPIAALYFDSQGHPVFLERSQHARTVEALAAKRDAADQARAERMKPRARR